MAIAGDCMIWFAEDAMNKMGRIDPVTGKIDEFDIPVEDSFRGRWDGRRRKHLGRPSWRREADEDRLQNHQDDHRYASER